MRDNDDDAFVNLDGTEVEDLEIIEKLKIKNSNS